MLMSIYRSGTLPTKTILGGEDTCSVGTRAKVKCKGNTFILTPYRIGLDEIGQ